MAKNGEIQNRDILQRMADFLNIGGVRRFPIQLNTDIVQPVYDIQNSSLAYPPAAPTFTSKVNNSGNFPAGATFDVGVNLVGSGAVASFLPPTTGGDVPVVTGTESKIICISANIGYVAAGAAADAAAGVRIIVMIVLRNIATGTLAFAVQDEVAVVENLAPYAYAWTFPQGTRFKNAGAQVQTQGSLAGWDGYVPPGYTCHLLLSRTAGLGFYPNLTSLDTYFVVAQRPYRGDWKA